MWQPASVLGRNLYVLSGVNIQNRKHKHKNQQTQKVQSKALVTGSIEQLDCRNVLRYIMRILCVTAASFEQKTQQQEVSSHLRRFMERILTWHLAVSRYALDYDM